MMGQIVETSSRDRAGRPRAARCVRYGRGSRREWEADGARARCSTCLSGGGLNGIEILEVVPDAVIAEPQSAALALLHEPVTDQQS